MTPRTLAECRWTTGYSSARVDRRSGWGTIVITIAACAVIGWLLHLGV